MTKFIFYQHGIYEILRETDSQVLLKEKYSVRNSRLVFGWVNRNDICNNAETFGEQRMDEFLAKAKANANP